MSLGKVKPFYVSLGVKHNYFADRYIYASDTVTDSVIDAEAHIQYHAALVDKASDYMVAIERLELSLNGIPFYDATPRNEAGVFGHEKIVCRSTVTNDTTEVDVTDNAYSLTHLFDNLGLYEFEDPNTAAPFFMTFSIDNNGFIIFAVNNADGFDNMVVEFPRRLNQILGISSDRNTQVVNENSAYSTYPRIDLGDDLDHLIICSNLPTYADSINNVKTNVLTDLCPPSSYSNSMQYTTEGTLTATGFSVNMRQKVIYYPTERRMLELIGDFPIHDIRIWVYYKTQDEQLKKVPLVFGGNFEIKLGFYQKT